MSFLSKILTPQLKRKIRKFFSFRYKGKVKKDFTIISNNCWGGVIYDILGKQYTSPTIGVLFTNEEYIKLLENLDFYLSQEVFLDNNRQKRINKHQGDYYAYLSDVSFRFVHYSSGQDGLQKWKRRCLRIVRNNLIVRWSITEQEIKNFDLIERFSKLPFDKKIMFTSNEEIAKKYNFAVFVKSKKHETDPFKDSANEIAILKRQYKIKNVIDIINR